MEGRGGCCIARYTGGGVYDLSKVGRIMLRFRPIAPKPVTGSTPSGGSPSETGANAQRAGRTKRKYVRDSGNTNNTDESVSNSNKRCSRRKNSKETRGDPVVTLPLLPEAPDRRDYSSSAGAQDLNRRTNVPMWPSLENCGAGKESDLNQPEKLCRMMPEPVRSLESRVTVECVTDTWLNANCLGSTDTERRANLDEDACPGFISDVLGRVTWTNWSFRKMVSENKGYLSSDCTEAMEVRLMMKENVAVVMGAVFPYPAFTCRVRLQYSTTPTSGCGRERNSLTLPCDVWRMDNGGFAWRLDVKTALSLSLGR